MVEKKKRKRRRKKPVTSMVDVLDTGNSYMITSVLLSSPVYCEGEQVPQNVKALVGNLPVGETVTVKRIRSL